MNESQIVEMRDISIKALHASIVRAMSAYIEQPSLPLAETVTRLLFALSNHPERFVPPCGHDIYSVAYKVWNEKAALLRASKEAQEGAAIH